MPYPFSIAAHTWLPADWRDIFKPEEIVRESCSNKSILVRLDWRKGENKAVTQNPKDTVEAYYDAKHGLETLFHRAEHGSEHAALRLAEFFREACSRLSRLCKEQPKLFQRAARQSWRWPVMMSTHPRLCDDYKAIFKALQLGKDIPLELDKYAKWKWDDAADIAFALLCYLWQSRSENRRTQMDYGKFGEAVDCLPKFTDDSANEWWRVARVVFLFTYPKPETVPELAKLVKPLTRRRSPGRMKQAILELLKARFISFAPAASAYRT